MLCQLGLQDPSSNQTVAILCLHRFPKEENVDTYEQGTWHSEHETIWWSCCLLAQLTSAIVKAVSFWEDDSGKYGSVSLLILASEIAFSLSSESNACNYEEFNNWVTDVEIIILKEPNTRWRANWYHNLLEFSIYWEIYNAICLCI
jgi:hypothetical protein